MFVDAAVSVDDTRRGDNLLGLRTVATEVVGTILVTGFAAMGARVSKSEHWASLGDLVSSWGRGVVGAFVMVRSKSRVVEGVDVVFVASSGGSYGHSLVVTAATTVVAGATTMRPWAVAGDAAPAAGAGFGVGRLMLEDEWR
jgi:hypothetical protein